MLLKYISADFFLFRLIRNKILKTCCEDRCLASAVIEISRSFKLENERQQFQLEKNINKTNKLKCINMLVAVS